MSVGDRLTEIRKKLGLSQAKFADLVGASLSSQKRYEIGERIPDASYLERVRQAGGDVAYLLSGDGAPPSGKKYYSLRDKNPDWELLARVLDGIETEISQSGMTISSEKKSRTVVMLYRAFRASGVIDPQMIKEALCLAADGVSK